MKSPLIILLLLMSSLGFAQTEVFEKTLAYGNQIIAIDAELVDEIKVSNWTKDQIAFKVTYSVNQGELNDLVQLDLNESSNRVKLKVDFDQERIEVSGIYVCDDERSLNWNTGGRKSSVCLDIQIELMVPKNTKLDIESVIGDLYIEGVYQELYAKTVTGDIEVNWPETEGAELEIKTVSGGIYTNHDFKMRQEKGLPLISAHEVQGNIGEAGRYLNLETVTSNIYFKRTK